MSQLDQQEVWRSVTSKQGPEDISPSVENPVGEDRGNTVQERSEEVVVPDIVL